MSIYYNVCDNNLIKIDCTKQIENKVDWNKIITIFPIGLQTNPFLPA